MSHCFVKMILVVNISEYLLLYEIYMQKMHDDSLKSCASEQKRRVFYTTCALTLIF